MDAGRRAKEGPKNNTAENDCTLNLKSYALIQANMASQSGADKKGLGTHLLIAGRAIEDGDCGHSFKILGQKGGAFHETHEANGFRKLVPSIPLPKEKAKEPGPESRT